MFVALRRIHVAASDFTRSRRFYSETLGLTEAASFEKDWVEFGLGPVILKLTPLRQSEVSARNQVALVLSTPALDSTLHTLKERGVTVTRGPWEEFTGRSAEILDPDGYRILVFQPSELHPDEEWISATRLEDLVKERVEAELTRERARAAARKPEAVRKAPAKDVKKASHHAKPAHAKPHAKKAPPKKPAGKKTPARPGKR